MKIPKGKLKFDGETGDGKAMFIVHSSNDGYYDLRIEIDTDDVNSRFAKRMARELVRRWNSAEKVRTTTKGVE